MERAMNQRQRVLAALRHQEPDRVPIDFGGTTDSTIMAVAYPPLRTILGLGSGCIRVADVYQQTALIEDDVRRALDVDTYPVHGEPVAWRDGTLTDGTPAQLPARFLPSREPDGSRVVRNAEGKVIAYKAPSALYFEVVHMPLSGATDIREIDACLSDIEGYDVTEHLDKTYEELAATAKHLRESTDYPLVGYFGGHIFQASQSLRGWDTFLVDLLVNQRFAEALMDRLAEANIRRFEHYARTVGQYLDVIHFEEDLGMQDRPLVRPELYRKLIKPYQSKMFGFVKSHTKAFILLHTDGAVAPMIPDFIEMGIDAINPVQVSAAGMDTKELKKQFGRDISFWGASCDSQAVLPFGTPADVADEVKRRIDDMAPGGGYVFSPIHNIQVGVPAENSLALFRTAREYGVYRAK
jgi:uroporphyrinogen decarboxylase